MKLRRHLGLLLAVGTTAGGLGLAASTPTTVPADKLTLVDETAPQPAAPDEAVTEDQGTAPTDRAYRSYYHHHHYRPYYSYYRPYYSYYRPYYSYYRPYYTYYSPYYYPNGAK